MTTPHRPTPGADRAAHTVGLALILPRQAEDPDDPVASVQAVLRAALHDPAPGDSSRRARSADPDAHVGRGGARTP